MKQIEHIDWLREYLAVPKKCVITTHVKPDGDAIGSSLGWYHYLTGRGHDVSVIAPSDYPESLHWLEGDDQVVIAPNNFNEVKRLTQEADYIFCLDYNDLRRVQDVAIPVMKSDAIKILIDHHLEPELFYTNGISEPTASSTAELVYRVIMELEGKEYQVSKTVAECLYMGILTDTGGFRFSGTTPELHRIVAQLIESGANPNEIQSNIFDNNSLSRLKLIGNSLLNDLHVLWEHHTAYFCIKRETAVKFDIQPGDLTGLVNYALSIKGINMGTLMIDSGTIIKMSFRSKGQFSVSEFAGNFDGGGHFNASGGRSETTLEETEKRFLNLLDKYKEGLNY